MTDTAPIVKRVLSEFGIGPYSLVGGNRVGQVASRAIRRDREERKDETLRFVEGQWDLDFDEESGDEAWWIELQLLDKETGFHLATLSLSDVEAHGLVDALLKMITEGRERFR